MPKEPHYPGESEEYPEYEGEESIEEDIEEDEKGVESPERDEPPRFKSEEPILLYIRTGVGTYSVVDRPFDSRVAASHFAEENFPGEKYKIYTQSEAVAEGEKQQK